MLSALCAETSHIVHTGSTSCSADVAARQLQGSRVFQQAIQQLVRREVEGCTKDLDRALQLKAQGAASVKEGSYNAAAQHYSDALTWLPVASQPAEAARLHSNRALCLLKLATAAAAARDLKPCAGNQQLATAAAAARVLGPAAGNQLHSSSAWQQLAAAAVDDCTAALACCEANLTHKVLFRRAQAQLLLQRHKEAAADCTVAAAAAQQCRAPGTAAAVNECKELLLQIKETSARHHRDSAGHVRCEAPVPAAVCSVQMPQQQTQQQQQQEPPNGPSLEQLNLLLAYQQQQAHQYCLKQQQQQQHQGGVPLLPQAVSLQLQHRLRLAPDQQSQQQQDKQQQLASAPATIQCCYSTPRGRHLVAAADILAGSVVLAELPLAAVPVKPQRPQQSQPQQRSDLLAQTGTRLLQSSSSSSSNGRRCSWCFQGLGMSVWPCPACPLALYCSWACCQAACTSSSTAAATPAPQQTSLPNDTTAAAAACCAEHAPEGVECGKPWLRLLPEEAVLAGRCLRARAQAAATAAAAAAVRGGCGKRDSCRQQQQQLPQCQWQELCQQQRELHLGVLRATLLDSLAYHMDSSSARDNNSSVTGTGGSQQQQIPAEQQHIEQLTLASIVSCVHAEAAAADRTAPSTAQHGTAGTDSPAAVLKCLQQLVANGIAIKPFLSSGPGDRWGLGLYPVTAAVLNHSCDPNCSVRFDGRQLLLICHRGAVAGQDLTISYGPQVGKHLTRERQEHLQQQYGFTCTCTSCCQGRQGTAVSTAAMPAEAQHVGAAESQVTPLSGCEAAAVGLACCYTLPTANSRGDGSTQAACPGVVMPAQQVPAGIVSMQPLQGSLARVGGGGSRGTGHTGHDQQAAQCTVCGWVMLFDMLQAKLLLLQAAAADVDAACGMMADVAKQQQRHVQEDLQQVQEAVGLLQRATAVRQQHLAAGNMLLGQSHHAAAVAVVEAAVTAARLGEQQGGHSSSSVRGAGDELLQQSLAVLQDTLAMQTEADVCSVLLRLQGLVHMLQEAVLACSCSKCSASVAGVQAADNVLQLACSCPQVSAAHEAQHSLSLAFLHFSSSVAVLACGHPPDALAVAVEKAACCAAGLALVSCSVQGLPGQHHCSSSCCRCSAVLSVVARLLQEVVAVVQAHLGVSLLSAPVHGSGH